MLGACKHLLIQWAENIFFGSGGAFKKQDLSVIAYGLLLCIVGHEHQDHKGISLVTLLCH